MVGNLYFILWKRKDTKGLKKKGNEIWFIYLKFNCYSVRNDLAISESGSKRTH